MRIVIDMQGAQTQSRFRGIGRYSLSLSLSLVKNRADNEIFLLLSAAFPETIQTIKDAFAGLIPPQNIFVWFAEAPLKQASPKNCSRQNIAEVIREEVLNSLNPDVVLITSLFEGFGDDALTSVKRTKNNFKTAVILYDLIPYIHPKHYLSNELMKKYYLSKIEYLKKADYLFAISDSSQQEAINYLEFDAKNITNISSATSDIFKPRVLAAYEKQKLFFRYDINKKFIMYAPGGFDYRKNVDMLLEAYANLPIDIRQNYQLLIASKISKDKKQYLEELAISLGIKENELIIAGYISDDDLVSLYNLTNLFVFPSIHEGFGLPLLEAMSCSACVIGSNTSSIPEVIQRDDSLFDPNSSKELTDLMTKILRSPSLQNELKLHSVKQSSKFSWDKSAKTLLNFLSKKIVPKLQTSNQTPLSLEPFKHLISDKKFSNNDIATLSHYISLNNPKERLPAIYIDITVLNKQDYGTGIQRVVRAVISELFKSPIEGYESVLVHFEKQNGKIRCLTASTAQAKLTSTSTTKQDEVIEPKSGDIFFGLDLVSDVIEAHKQGLFQRYKASGVKIKFVIYDILPILYPQWWPEGGSVHHTNWLLAIADVADELISISSSVNDEVQEYLKSINFKKTKNIKFSWFHLGADLSSSLPSLGMPQNADAILSKLTAAPTFLMVGTIEPRKGHFQTLQAFDILWNENYDINLAIVGKSGWLVEDAVNFINAHPQKNIKLFWFDSISDEFLEKLYASSSALIAASQAEGFGLPLIEAAKHSLPLIARDIPVFKEVAQNHAFYFTNTASAQDLAQSIKEFLSLYKTDLHPKTDSMPYLNWQQSVENLKTHII
ncbi:glycosyltransferase family 1 protein [Sulfurimonas sp.]|uniref:glycosyltransferase family 4 protein n=1 Tax=Sulfurimonas sp. TaxID=2022749 RepID=UPI00286E9E0B|nr:glycosyltransferase family 1 protein [Sulfurimonas sp.]